MFQLRKSVLSLVYLELKTRESGLIAWTGQLERLSSEGESEERNILFCNLCILNILVFAHHTLDSSVS